MKLTNLRGRIAAALAAAGLFIGSSAHANNLVVNGDFENVDTNVSMGGYNAVLLLDWTAPTGDGYAYSHDPGTTGVPDYSNGGPLAGGGLYYFTSNANSPDNDASNPIQQDVDVSGMVGEPYLLSAFFSSYSDQGDYGVVQVDFLDAAGGSLAIDAIDNEGDTMAWVSRESTGMIPMGASTARVSVWGTALSGGPDGYVDNVNLSIVPEPTSLGLLGLGALSLFSWRRR